LIKLEMFKKDERAVSNIIVAALLIGIGVLGTVGIAALVSNVSNVERPPQAQFNAEDHPDDILTGSSCNGVACAITIRDIGGDRVKLDNLLIAVYNTTTDMKVFEGVASKINNVNATIEQLTAGGHSDLYLEGGEQIILWDSTVSTPGTYRVMLYYGPTMSAIYSKDVVVN